MPELATQTHLSETGLPLRKDIEQVRAELKTDIAQTKVDAIKWIVGMLVVQPGPFGGLLKLLGG